MNTWEIKNTDINIKEKEKVTSHISCWNLCKFSDGEMSAADNHIILDSTDTSDLR
jgi:hypothetical protein